MHAASPRFHLTFTSPFKGSLEELESVHFLSLADDIFRSVPIMTLAFTCHMNIFPIITGLKLPTRRRVEHVTMGSLTICFCIYSILGVFGYLTFFTYDKVSGNILLNYDVDQPEIVVGRFAVTLVVMFSYPILAHPCINSVDALLFPKVWNPRVSTLLRIRDRIFFLKRWYILWRPLNS